MYAVKKLQKGTVGKNRRQPATQQMKFVKQIDTYSVEWIPVEHVLLLSINLSI